MSIRQTLQDYRAGMTLYDRCHKPTLGDRWQALADEWNEFTQCPSLTEAWDILHSAGRIAWSLTGIPFQLLAWPTVVKHARRFAQRGCIRSARNCRGDCAQVSRLDKPVL